MRYAVGFILSLCFLFPDAPAFAQGGPVRKLGRGAANLVTGWMEVPAQVLEATEQSGSIAGVTVGLGRGLLFGLGRTLAGAFEVATFPLPNPKTHYGPMVRPEFVVFRDADKE